MNTQENKQETNHYCDFWCIRRFVSSEIDPLAYLISDGKDAFQMM